MNGATREACGKGGTVSLRPAPAGSLLAAVKNSLSLAAVLLVACGGSPAAGPVTPASSTTTTAPTTPVVPTATTSTPAAPIDQAALVSALVGKYGEGARARATRGVRQVASFWRPADGDAAAFVQGAFVSDPAQLDALLKRFSAAFEQIDGHLLEIHRALNSWSELELGPQMDIDQTLAGFDVGAHLSEDLFTSKLAFVALLNFPLPTLDEMIAQGPGWSRRDWAAVRLLRRSPEQSGQMSLRPSGAAAQAHAKAQADSDAYIAGYNVWMHHVLTPDGKRVFPKGVRLLSHWNLRDEIRADYADKDHVEGVARQRLILEVMKHIVTQTIPQGVIDDPRVDWNPATNAVTLAPDAEVEVEQMKSQGKRPAQPVATTDREPDTRYAMLLEDFHAQQMADADSPLAPTEIDRHFQLDDEIPEARVRTLLTEILSSPLVPKVAALAKTRLGRPLEPFDIWFDAFGEAKQPEDELSRITRKKYPTAEAYKKDLPRLFRALGFTPEKARFLDSHIAVDPARGSGHALEAMRRSELYPWWGAGDSAHLRTRVNPDGMDFKGYNIAVHEMCHNVEQTFSLYEVDDTLMAGVPGTAFTEALAFTCQHRDRELLGVGKPDPRAAHIRALVAFWSAYEIAGSALVDLDAWHWMYDHPSATPAELRDAMVKIASATWDKYYAPVLGSPGDPQLAIYSHIINSFLYLYRYPIGHLIAFQLEQKLVPGPAFGAEFERAASFGRVLPDMWMEHATGKPVSTGPLLEATAAALDAVK